MRELRYHLEISDTDQRDGAPISFTVAVSLVRSMDWKLPDPVGAPGGKPRAPFLLFLDEGESFFMLMPEEGGLRLTARVTDKWNLIGLVPRDKTFSLNFGVVPLEDALTLLKFFYEDNYPALRAVEKRMAY